MIESSWFAGMFHALAGEDGWTLDEPPMMVSGAAAARLALVVGAEARAGLALLGHGLGVPGGEDAVPRVRPPTRIGVKR